MQSGLELDKTQCTPSTHVALLGVHLGSCVAVAHVGGTVQGSAPGMHVGCLAAGYLGCVSYASMLTQGANQGTIASCTIRAISAADRLS